MLPIAAVLPPLPRFKVVDVGASLGLLPPDYADLAKAVPCDIVGFEPVAIECEKLKALKRPGHVYLPYTIGDGAVHTFYECNSPYNSSLFEPNLALTEKFQNLSDFMRVTRTHAVETRRLDSIVETEGMDFLKVDVQGAELLVFEGAVERLKNVLVIHTEVEFVPMYKNQPLFADVDSFLRAHGFAFHKLTPWGRTFKPIIMKHDPGAALSQSLWGDAVYVRDFMTFEGMLPVALLKLATILHENEKSYDLVAATLAAYDRQMNTAMQENYLRQMLGG